MIMDKPLVTALVITYKAEKYIKETLDSVFCQTYDNVEVVISDDNSPDNTFAEIKKYISEYSGTYKVTINQNSHNLGIAGNVNKGIELSHGDYICLFDGDDIALPERIEKSVELIENYHVEGLTFNMELIDSKSTHIRYFNDVISNTVDVYDIEDYIKGKYLSGGAARIISRKLVDTFGPLSKECNTEDSTYMFRTFLTGGAVFGHSPMVKYRIHDSNVSSFHGLMTRFDTKSIYNQYKRDLDIAIEKDFVTLDQYEKIDEYLTRYLYENLALRKLYNMHNYLKRLLFVFCLLFDKHYSINQVRALFRQIKWWHREGITN